MHICSPARTVYALRVHLGVVREPAWDVACSPRGQRTHNFLNRASQENEDQVMTQAFCRGLASIPILGSSRCLLAPEMSELPSPALRSHLEQTLVCPVHSTSFCDLMGWGSGRAWQIVRGGRRLDFLSHSHLLRGSSMPCCTTAGMTGPQ